jgi:hypothetical protein
MTAGTDIPHSGRHARLAVALVLLMGCGGEPPPEQIPAGPPDSVTEAVGDTLADTVMARDTAR